MDEQVLKAQKWVNATYANVSGYVACAEDGLTGWGTIHSLTRALQHELGILVLSDAFGPATLSSLTAYGDIQTSSGKNLKTIAEAALYCKGYSGGGLDGSFNQGTLIGISSLRQDLGLGAAAALGHVTPKLMKALLTMDAYVLLPGGDHYVRDVQQWMNLTFSGRRDFYLIPCDGFFSRAVQQSLVKAIQYSLGMADGVADGIWGSGTSSALKASGTVRVGSSDSGSNHLVSLFKAALIFNNWPADWSVNAFTSGTATATSSFQRFVLLPVTGIGDYQTWASLLVSTGDADRKGKAADCRTPLNAARIAALKAAGYETVGRYLTGAADKALTSSEISLVLGSGLTLFPIYQVYNNQLDLFSFAQGQAAAALAVSAAAGFGIPAGTVIYFAVDYDATSDEIDSNILQHFRGIQSGMAADSNHHYTVGVYGSRNVCSRVSAAGLARRSFVSGMSTGFSGNLGFQLPVNWAFDQIKTITLAKGAAGQLEIDNDIRSGRDMGISTLSGPADPNQAFYNYLQWVEGRVEEWKTHQGHVTHSSPDFVAMYLRAEHGTYSNPDFTPVAGSEDSAFLAFVNGSAGRPTKPDLLDPVNLAVAQTDHFGLAAQGVALHGINSNKSSINVGEAAGWAGDLLTVLMDFVNSGLPDDQAYTFGMSRIAGAQGQFKRDDFDGDVDGILLGWKYEENPELKLSNLYRIYYGSPSSFRGRYAECYALRFSGSEHTLLEAATSVFFQDTQQDPEYSVLRGALFLKQTHKLYTTVGESVRVDLARAFRDVFLSFV